MTNLEVARLAQSTRGGPFGKRQASKQARVPDSQARQTCIRLSTPQVRQSRMQLDNPNKQAGCKVHGKASTWHTPKQWALVQNMQVVCSRPDSRQARTCPRSRKQRQQRLQGKAAHKAGQPLEALQTTPQSRQVNMSVSQDAQLARQL